MKFVSGGWCIAQYLPLFSDVKTMFETVTEKSLPITSTINEEILINNEIMKEDLTNKADLINRIEMLENKQTHHMV